MDPKDETPRDANEPNPEEYIGRRCWDAKGLECGVIEHRPLIPHGVFVRWPDGRCTRLQRVTTDPSYTSAGYVGRYDAKVRPDGDLEIT